MCEADLAGAKGHQDLLPGPALDVRAHQRDVGYHGEVHQVLAEPL